MALADKCRLRIPFKEWAQKNKVEGGKDDFENWKALERWANECVGRTLATAAAGVVLNLRGQVTTVETDRYYPPPNLSPLQPQYFTASLTALGTGTTTVEIRKNGVAVATLTPSSATGLHYIALTETWDTADYATIAVTSFGVGARGLIAGLA
jgi:hypothetical protein